MRKVRPKKSRLFRKHRIVVWETEGLIFIGKVVDSTIEKVGIKTTVKVGEICSFERDPEAKEGYDRKRQWLIHVNTYDLGDRQPVSLKLMRVPTITDKKIYNVYRK